MSIAGHADALRVGSVLARHAIPVLGALFLGWSAHQSVIALVLETLTGLWCLAGIAAWFVTLRNAVRGGHDRFEIVTNGIVLFVLTAGVVTLPVAILFAMLWFALLSRSGLELRELLDWGFLGPAAAGMLLLQLPRFAEAVSIHDEDTAQHVVGPEAGFLVKRLALIAGACSFLSFLSGGTALIGALVVTQALLAANEILGDRLFHAPLPEQRPGRAKRPSRHRRGR